MCAFLGLCRGCVDVGLVWKVEIPVFRPSLATTQRTNLSTKFVKQSKQREVSFFRPCAFEQSRRIT